MRNSRHNGCTYAATRYAQEFLDAVDEHHLARALRDNAEAMDDPMFPVARAEKCLVSCRRKRDQAKTKLDSYRRLIKGERHESA